MSDAAKPPGYELMQELVDQIKKLNENIERHIEVADELCAHHEVLVVTAGILEDVGSSGKKITAGDVASAIRTAAEEVFGDDDDEGGDEDPPDPEVVGPAPKKRGSLD